MIKTPLIIYFQTRIQVCSYLDEFVLQSVLVEGGQPQAVEISLRLATRGCSGIQRPRGGRKRVMVDPEEGAGSLSLLNEGLGEREASLI